jgi:nitrite reductase/ring-hydroxylating ferredoxin subunit
MSYKEIAKIEQVGPGTLLGINLDGKDVLLVNAGGKFYALPGKCPHMGGDLAKGRLEGNTLTCPRHHAQFDVTTGKNLSGPKIGPLKLKTKDLAVYAVKLEGPSIMVELG